MRKSWILVVLAVIVICIVAGCSKEVKTYTDPEQPIDISVNKVFVITLDGENMINGIHWEANYDTSMLDKIDEKHGLNGSTGKFVFKALQVGDTEIIMVYVQWSASKEMGEEITWQEPKVFTVNIR